MSGPTKRCRVCQQEKPATTEYFVRAPQCRYGVDNWCRECHRVYHRAWKAKNDDRIKARRRVLYFAKNRPIQLAKERARRERAPLCARATILRQGMSARSRELGFAFDSDVFTTAYLRKWLENQPNCECCSQSLDLSFKFDGKKKDASPTIDRIDNTKGYVVGNVALICWRCNNLKRDASVEELELVVAWMRVRAAKASPVQTEEGVCATMS